MSMQVEQWHLHSILVAQSLPNHTPLVSHSIPLASRSTPLASRSTPLASRSTPLCSYSLSRGLCNPATLRWSSTSPHLRLDKEIGTMGFVTAAMTVDPVRGHVSLFLTTPPLPSLHMTAFSACMYKI